jgi:hypothetical protein
MAFKMKGNPYKMGKIATKSAMEMKTSYKMKEAMAKMKSPMELKKDSPMDKYKSDAQRKAVHASKAEKGMTMKKEAPMKAAKPDYIDLDGDGNKTESMKQAAADKKSGAKMKKASPNKKNVPTEREANMAEERKLNKEGGKLDPRDPIMRSIRDKKFDKADKLSMERTKRSREGNPMQMKKPPLKQDKKKNKKRKLSVLDKLSAASRAISTSEGPFGDTNFMDRYKEAKRGIRKTGIRSKDALMGSNR